MHRNRIVQIVCVVALLAWAAPVHAEGRKEALVRAKTSAKDVKAFDARAMQGALDRLHRFESKEGQAAARASQTPALPEWARRARQEVISNRSGAQVRADFERGVVEVRPQEAERPLRRRARPTESPEETARRFVGDNAAIFGLDAPERQLAVERTESDELGMTHVFFGQVLDDVPVWGRQLIAHLGPLGDLDSVNCLLESNPAPRSRTPQIAMAQAIDIALAHLREQGVEFSLTDDVAAAFDMRPSQADLYYWNEKPLEPLTLVWIVEVRPNLRDWMRFFISAEDGAILSNYNATPCNCFACDAAGTTENHQAYVQPAQADPLPTLRSAASADGPATTQATNLLGQTVTLNTYRIGSDYHMLDGSRDMFVAGQTGDQLLNDPKGSIVTWDLKGKDLAQGVAIYAITSSKNNWTDATAVSAHDYAGRAYTYYKTVHGRNSLDGAGGTIFSLIHVSSDGQPMGNAFWNGKAMAYGDGDDYFLPLARALDVAGHEMTHGVINHSADMEYKFQPGALNESYADVFGILMDTADYKVGEDVVKKTAFPSGALRDMADPHNGGSSLNDPYWQPAHMSEFANLTIQQDNGGVHVNSGIPNRAAYLVIDALGHAEAEKIYYRALTTYLGKQSNFLDARVALARSAADLFGADSNQEKAVKDAFDQVGIVAGQQNEEPTEVPEVSGNQFIIVVGAAMYGYYIYGSTPALQSAELVSMMPVNAISGRPIAVDPYGQAIFYVDAYNALRGINASGEMIIDDYYQWSSVAISPSRRYVALTRSAEENKIIILDLVEEQSSEITLLHPTTGSGGEYQDIVRLADSMAFIDDRLLAYDSLNTISSPGGESVDFWDVNVLDVATGKILPILPPQSKGIDVGNPTIASRSGSIMYLDVVSPGAAAVLAVNLFTGQANIVFNNGTDPSYPDFSVDDEYLIFSRPNEDDSIDVYRIPLSEDKMSAAGPEELIWPDTMLPNWYAAGTPPSASVGFASAASNGVESATAASISVVLSAATADTVTIDYAVTGGNAIGSGVDYALTNGRLTFAPQETQKPIPLAVVNDALEESDEQITITLSRPVSAWMGANQAHAYTILDDDETPEPVGPIRDMVTHFYQKVLGRAPEAGAVDAWENGYYRVSVQNLVDVRFVMREMGRLFFLSEEYDNRHRSDRNFIIDCYEAFLMRTPGESDIAAWLSDTDPQSGKVRWNRGEVMTQFAESGEFAAMIARDFPNQGGNAARNFVTTMYVGVFDRLADIGGLEYWAGQIAGSADKKAGAIAMANAFFNSEEGQTKAPTNEMRVIRLYRAFLGRFPATDEISYWKAELDSGRQQLATLIATFANSGEFAAILARYFG